MSHQSPAPEYAVGDAVEKVGGDYTFAGHVVARFLKRSGKVRFVVEDDRGVLHVYSAANLRPALPPEIKQALDATFARNEAGYRHLANPKDVP
jgi:hypothetical protein